RPSPGAYRQGANCAKVIGASPSVPPGHYTHAHRRKHARRELKLLRTWLGPPSSVTLTARLRTLKMPTHCIAKAFSHYYPKDALGGCARCFSSILSLCKRYCLLPCLYSQSQW